MSLKANIMDGNSILIKKWPVVHPILKVINRIGR